MNNLDDLFNTDYAVKAPFDKDAWIERKKQERDEAYALLDTATGEITKDPERFRDFLNTQARFDRYSVSNAILIAYQRPGAERLADFSDWKEKNVSVSKGEKAITILEPGNEFTREDGSTGVSMSVKKVFDISQTSDSNRKTSRRIPDAREAIRALIAVAPCKIVLVDELKDSNARYSADKDTIFVVKGLEANEIFRAMSFEIGIAKCAQNDMDRKDAMFPAYCAAYILCERYGFDTGDFNFDKAPEQFTGKDKKEIRKTLGSIREMANGIGRDMSRGLEAAEKSERQRSDTEPER